VLAACSSGDTGTNPPTGGGPDTTPAAIAVGTGSNQTGEAGTELPEQFAALVTNSQGSVLSGVTVNWTVEAGGGSLDAATSATNAQGLAFNTYTLGADAGANRVRAAIQGTNLSTTFTATATEPPPDTVATSIEITGGNGQSAIVGEILENPLTVVVKSAGGEPIGGKLVSWNVTAGDGFILQTETVTNGVGVATNFYQVGSSEGTESIDVVVTGNPDVKAIFTANVTAPPATADVSVQDNVFEADYVVVAAGGTVTWTWAGSNQHNVTWASGGWPNSATQTSGTHSVTFDTPGTYVYYCSIHGSATSGMRGTVVVK
jgi:plastocyanin